MYKLTISWAPPFPVKDRKSCLKFCVHQRFRNVQASQTEEISKKNYIHDKGKKGQFPSCLKTPGALTMHAESLVFL